MAGKNVSGKTERTSISLPESLKRQMDNVDINWSALLRETIVQRLNRESQRDLAEALMINERLRRKAPKGWDSTRVIRQWRSRR